LKDEGLPYGQSIDFLVVLNLRRIGVICGSSLISLIGVHRRASAVSFLTVNDW
jgi:hypothetical protein